MTLKLDKGILKLEKKIFSTLTVTTSLYTLGGVYTFYHEPSISSSIFLGTSFIASTISSYCLIKTKQKLKKCNSVDDNQTKI